MAVYMCAHARLTPEQAQVGRFLGRVSDAASEKRVLAAVKSMDDSQRKVLADQAAALRAFAQRLSSAIWAKKCGPTIARSWPWSVHLNLSNVYMKG